MSVLSRQMRQHLASSSELPHVTPQTTRRAAAPDVTPQTAREADSPLVCVLGTRSPKHVSNRRQAAELRLTKLKNALHLDLSKVSSKAFFGFEFFAAAFLKEFRRYFWRSCRPKCYLKACPKVQKNGAVSAAENRRDRPENRTAGAAQLLRISALVRFSGWCGGIWSACRVSSGGVQPRYGAPSAVPSGGKAGVSQELQVGQASGAEKQVKPVSLFGAAPVCGVVVVSERRAR